MTWLRILTAVGILAVAASALLVFALCTAAARGDRGGHGDSDNGSGDGPGGSGGGRRDGVREDAERSGLIRPTNGED
ncbi:hypothetical protein OH807_38920 [Kitasatospora sp. NBC_01560]|uniref:hypothetical protein n=1 Tax=Kitasatospora sp. NBC_01560 TaxID=2975965 RepID=UPI00386DEBD5